MCISMSSHHPDFMASSFKGKISIYDAHYHFARQSTTRSCVGELINGWPAIGMQKTHAEMVKGVRGVLFTIIFANLKKSGIAAVWFAALSGLKECLCLFVWHNCTIVPKLSYSSGWVFLGIPLLRSCCISSLVLGGANNAYVADSWGGVWSWLDQSFLRELHL